MEQRLQKILAEMGLASQKRRRRDNHRGQGDCKRQVAAIGMKADMLKDHIKWMESFLQGRKKRSILCLTNPEAYVTTLSEDPEGRPSIRDYLRGHKTEGLSCRKA